MNGKKDCKIVQDLLPNYIDKLTNEETNRYIDEHLKECNKCKNMLENMRKEINITSKTDEREINYIKKFSKKMRLLKIILLVFIIAYVLLVGRRTFIMISLSLKAKESQQIDNYYVKMNTYEGESLTIIESYNIEENYLTTIDTHSNNVKYTIYKNKEETIFLVDSKDGKYNIINREMIGMKIPQMTYVLNGFWENLQYALFIGIESDYCNGKECYVIKEKDYEKYIDKQTGLAVRYIKKAQKGTFPKIDTVVDYEYEHNVVKENDISKPDITAYIIFEE